jgi:thioredoxin reductase
VILALGRRGTPRKLAVQIPEAVASRVHYSMADARSFVGRRVLVVGLGDVAMEAAIALCRQPGTTVAVSYRGLEFRRGKGRNIDQVRRLAAAGRIQLLLGTEVEGISPELVRLRSGAGPIEVPWDAMLVMIGSLAPWGFLEAAGVARARVMAPQAGPEGQGTAVVS